MLTFIGLCSWLGSSAAATSGINCPTGGRGLPRGGWIGIEVGSGGVATAGTTLADPTEFPVGVVSDKFETVKELVSILCYF